MQLTPAAALRATVAILRRGIVCGGDVDELLRVYQTAMRARGVSLADGFGFLPKNRLLDIPPEWPSTHRARMHLDPSPAFLAASGPCAVFTIHEQARAERGSRELIDASRRAGFVDGAIVRIPRPRGEPLFMATYRTKGMRPFSTAERAQLSMLQPLFAAAFSATTALDAIHRERTDSVDRALSRVPGYAELHYPSREVHWSPSARAMWTARLGGVSDRGWRTLERMLHRAAAGFFAGDIDRRAQRLRADVRVELAFVPSERGHTRLLAMFVEEPKAPPIDARVPSSPSEELLSPRQREVARAASHGASLPAIARALGISNDAVRIHLREVYRRLAVSSRVELAVLLRSS